MSPSPEAPEYTVDWFSNNIEHWEKIVKPRFQGKPGIRALEVGSFEGRSARWLLENVLTHPTAKMVCVDSFDLGPKAKDVRARFLKNMKPFKSKVTLIEGESGQVLKRAALLKPASAFDLIYIDANHHSRHVLEDAVLSFALLKEGGLLIFDDYTHNKEHDNKCPKPGINAFLSVYAEEIRVIYTEWQVIVEKKKARRSKLCFSENYPEPPRASSMRYY